MASEDAGHLQQMLDEEQRNDKGNRNLQVSLIDDRESNKFVR